MQREVLSFFVEAAAPMLLGGLLGSVMACAYFFQKRSKSLRLAMFLLFPGALLIGLSLIGSGFVFMKGRNLIREFDSMSKQEILQRENYIIRLLMEGRYVEVAGLLGEIQKQAHLLQIVLLSAHGELVASHPADSAKALKGMTSLQLLANDIDGSPVKWGEIKYRVNYHQMYKWAQEESARWTSFSAFIS